MILLGPFEARLLSPLQFGGERPGEGGRPRAQCEARRNGIEFSPLPEERGGRGRGVGDPVGRSAKPVAPRSNSPLSARNERGGAGGGAPRRRSSMPVAEPR